ncbi:MAG: PspC domain-containing protein [Candidatus Kerfeldbacteria bacterium]|nr:PspC domain-containing protein [Candidatus Kerfeldbacteria bacterium]
MEQPPVRRLYRSRTNRILCGVCGGLGEYFNIDPTLVRIIFLVASLGGGFGLILYIILWIIVPEHGQEQRPLEQRAQTAGEEMKDRAQKLAADVQAGRPNSAPALIGALLIGFGIIALVNQFMPIASFSLWHVFWPLVIVGIGVAILLKRT